MRQKLRRIEMKEIRSIAHYLSEKAYFQYLYRLKEWVLEQPADEPVLGRLLEQIPKIDDDMAALARKPLPRPNATRTELPPEPPF